MTIATSLMVAAAFPLTFAAFGLTGGDVVRAAENSAQNLGDLFSQRSPGARTAAQLTKTKKAQHALAKVRLAAAPIPPALVAALLPPSEGLPVDLGKPVALLQVAPPSPFETIIGPPGGIGGSPPGGGGSPPGGGGSSPPGGGPPVVRQPDLPSAVPEPGTWVTMLLGFGLLGWRFRREREARQAAAHA